MSSSDIGGKILLGASFVSLFVAPALTSIVEIVFFLLKLLGYIEWSWLVVLLSPLLIEAIPFAFWGIGFLLMILRPTPHANEVEKTPVN
jgi:hypothetical protein